jgi:hypothetical protein
MLGICGDSRLAVLSELFSADTSAIVERDQFRDAGGALTALDFDHCVIVDSQAIGRDILGFCNVDAAPDA